MFAATPSRTHPSSTLALPGAGRATRETGRARETLVGWLVRSGARRIVAGCLTILFALSCGEALIADVCDGDEGSGAVATMMVRATAQDATSDADAVSGMPAAHLDDSTSDHFPTSDRPHGVHVCHCTHAHGGMLGLRTGIVASVVPVTESHAARSDRLPPSPALDRQLRPPLLPQVA